MDCAVQLKDYLSQFSLNVWVDQRTKYTPGKWSASSRRNLI